MPITPIIIVPKIKSEDIAEIDGFKLNWISEYINKGNVVTLELVKNSPTTSSSKEIMKAKNPPAIKAGFIKGNVTRKIVFMGDAPRILEASSIEGLIRPKLATTDLTT